MVADVAQMSPSTGADGSALIRMKVDGCYPIDEDFVQWNLVDPNLTLEPGMKNGLYEALDKIVRTQLILFKVMV